MRFFLKIKLDKILQFFKKLPWLIGEQPFLAFLALLFISLMIGGLSFYKYNILIQKIEPEVIELPLQFGEGPCQEILEEWETREKKFAETQIKEYPDPFQSVEKE